jgi:hypothetical protein
MRPTPADQDKPNSPNLNHFRVGAEAHGTEHRTALGPLDIADCAAVSGDRVQRNPDRKYRSPVNGRYGAPYVRGARLLSQEVIVETAHHLNLRMDLSGNLFGGPIECPRVQRRVDEPSARRGEDPWFAGRRVLLRRAVDVGHHAHHGRPETIDPAVGNSRLEPHDAVAEATATFVDGCIAQ